MTKIEWACRAHAVIRSIEEPTITYGELARRIGYTGALWHQEFGTILAIIALEDPVAAGRVVSKATGQPSDGYYRWLETAGIPAGRN